MLLEVVLPVLLAIQYLIVLAFSVTGSLPAIVLVLLTCLIALPAWIASLQQRGTAKRGWCDAYLLVATGYLFFGMALWIVGVPIFVAYVLGYLLLRKTKPYAPAFIALVVCCSAALLVSGGAVRQLPTALGMPLVLGLVSFLPYFRILDRERWLARPAIGLALGMMHLIFVCLVTHTAGANTPWLTRSVLRQPGTQLLRAASRDLVEPRSVIPVPGGLFVYTERGALVRVSDDGLVELASQIDRERADAALCDPQDRAICYLPNIESGLTVVNTRTGEVRNESMPYGRYDRMHADRTRQRWVLISDTGRVITFLTREGPGDLQPVATLDMKFEVPGWVWSRAVDFQDDEARILVRMEDGQLQVLSYDFERGELWPFFVTLKHGYGRARHGVTIEDERVVYVTRAGKLLVFDWQGTLVWSKWLAPTVREVLYDRARRLVYVIDDFGFVSIVDPFQGELVSRFWVGPKAKNVHLEHDHLYVGSAAGLFRFDLEEVLGSSTLAAVE